jgi:plastocyanin
MYKTKIAIPIASLVLLMSLTSIFSFSTTYAQSPIQGAPISNNTSTNAASAIAAHPERFDAKQIYQTNNVTVIDPSIRNLAIIIPDNIAANRSSAHTWPTFLPASATIAAGMRVIWFNADVNATHNIVVRNATGAVLNSTSVPYQNASVYRFGQAGTYTFSDPSVPGLKNGTINVVKPQSFAANAFANSSGTMGLFVVPGAGKPSFDLHIHKLGFNAVSTFNFTAFPQGAANNTVQSTNNIAGTPVANGTSSGTKILYVWTQETSGIHTSTTRIANKVRILEDILYPHGMVKAR